MAWLADEIDIHEKYETHDMSNDTVSFGLRPRVENPGVRVVSDKFRCFCCCFFFLLYVCSISIAGDWSTPHQKFLRVEEEKEKSS